MSSFAACQSFLVISVKAGTLGSCRGKVTPDSSCRHSGCCHDIGGGCSVRVLYVCVCVCACIHSARLMKPHSVGASVHRGGCDLCCLTVTLLSIDPHAARSSIAL